MVQGNKLRIVVLLGAVSIVGIISVQTYFLLNSWNSKQKELHQSIVIALKNVSEKICRLNETTPPMGNPVRQLSSGYYVVDVNTVIDANVLEHYLKAEFERLNIKTDYEYAIYDCHTDRMVYGNYVSASGSGEKQRTLKSLPKYGEYLYYFGIRFPALKNTVAGDMAIMFFFTFILVISVIFFVYSIFVILQQKRLSEMQKDFINNMTHEFRTPISTISLSADVISSPGIVDDPERLFRYGGFIKQENQRLNLLVGKVLQIANIEKGGLRLKKESINLNELLRTVAESFSSRIKPGGRVDCSLSPDAGMVNADIVHLTNIFHNLFDNALKYGPEAIVVKIETRREARKVILTFADNGPGIDPKYRKRVFHKFFRVPSGNLHDVKGFGIGLYYVKIICRAHGWKIRLDGGPGARFVIEMPDQS
jgi:two-component system phosphate regulon sensor histidine kinase PhoR